MKVIIDDCVFEDDKAFIGLVFENDKERRRIARQILHMPNKEGKRGYIRFDDTNPDHRAKMYNFKQHLD